MQLPGRGVSLRTEEQNPSGGPGGFSRSSFLPAKVGAVTMPGGAGLGLSPPYQGFPPAGVPL